jgi:hypothetical protein
MDEQMITFEVSVFVNGRLAMSGGKKVAATEQDARFAAISEYIGIAPWDEGQDLKATAAAE